MNEPNLQWGYNDMINIQNFPWNKTADNFLLVTFHVLILTAKPKEKT